MRCMYTELHPRLPDIAGRFEVYVNAVHFSKLQVDEHAEPVHFNTLRSWSDTNDRGQQKPPKLFDSL